MPKDFNREQRIEEALADHAVGMTSSLRAAAEKWDVPESVLRYRKNRDSGDGERTETRWPSSPDLDGYELPAGPEAEYEELPVIHRDYSDHEKRLVYPAGDIHLGSPAHAAARWQEWVDYWLAHPETSWLCTGDLFNAALKDSKSEAYDDVMTVGRAKRAFAHQAQALADTEQIDGLMPGNHDARVYRAVGDCPVEDLADRLAVPYWREAALVVYHVGDQEYTIYVRHGTGSSGRASSNALRAGRDVVDADVYVNGHTHSMKYETDDVLRYTAGVVERRRRHYLVSGSFVQYEGYARERGYGLGRIGAPRIYLDGRHHDVHVSF